MYTWIFFGAKLYAETGLQIVCFGLMLYGWYEWLHGGTNRSVLPVSRTPGWAWTAVIVSGVALTAAIYAAQRRWTDNPAPLVDSAIGAWSLVAQWMTARKYLENWLFWIVINVVSVALYVARALYPTAVLYVALLIIAVLGYRDWRRTLASV